MIWIIYISLFYFTLTSLVLFRNHFGFRALRGVSQNDKSESPSVSICIPARNEETNIERCVTSALKQDYPDFEVLVLDDHSDDRTPDILEPLAKIIHNLKYIKGSEKPDDWLGKPWACHQLSEHAKGEILIFIDADVWLEPDVIDKTVSKLKSVDALTVWPEQKVETFWEKMIVPVVYHTLFSLLPAEYVERSPRWIPKHLRRRMNPKFAAACGQFFAFNRTAYDLIEGHTSVRDEVVEDVQLSKKLKEKGLLLQMMHGREAVYCRMYNNKSEVWNGFKKNFLAGFPSLFEFYFMWVLHITVYIFPFLLLIVTLGFHSDFGLVRTEDFQSFDLPLIPLLITVLLPVFQRIYLARKFGWPVWHSFLHIISVSWFQILAVVILQNRRAGRTASWKGRPV